MSLFRQPQRLTQPGWTMGMAMMKEERHQGTMNKQSAYLVRGTREKARR
jgi:hypothetical protein